MDLLKCDSVKKIGNWKFSSCRICRRTSMRWTWAAENDFLNVVMVRYANLCEPFVHSKFGVNCESHETTDLDESVIEVWIRRCMLKHFWDRGLLPNFKYLCKKNSSHNPINIFCHFVFYYCLFISFISILCLKSLKITFVTMIWDLINQSKAKKSIEQTEKINFRG